MKTQHITSGNWISTNPFTAKIERRGTCRLIGIGTGSIHIGYASITDLVPLNEAQANARAITAVPSMIEALEWYATSRSDNGAMAKRILRTIRGEKDPKQI